MNGKATVSKELNAKHAKILEGLLKLPENKECADCKSKGPRWASVNLGIFICLQCSGISQRYAEKRWVPRKVVRLEPKPEADKYLKPSSSDVEKEKLNWITFDTDMENPSSSFSGVSIPDPNPNIIKSMNLPSCEPKKPNTRNDIQPVFSAPNVDYATQLFDMLFKEESKENFKKESALPEGSKCWKCSPFTF
ncbi:unnamed protein product [Cuscuta epithymum]|uniref:Arf-GAP domain-containing protein n=1 Tax=Cuscuta epithymum TaxID=186058 RepID=A0AAV0FEH5_9ASTE|nr:unnamed protein product [Cuscuta epithymum]